MAKRYAGVIRKTKSPVCPIYGTTRLWASEGAWTPKYPDRSAGTGGLIAPIHFDHSFGDLDGRLAGRRGQIERVRAGNWRDETRGPVRQAEPPLSGALVQGECCLPTGIVEKQGGDDGASLQVQPAQVGETGESDASQKLAAVFGVVKADERCKKYFFSGAQNADGLLDQIELRTQIPDA